MYKSISLFLLITAIAACNAGKTPNDKINVTEKKAVAREDSASLDAKLSFIDGCVESSKLTLGEQKAYAFCNCIFNQAREKYNDIDSASIEALSDTAEVARMAANCR